MTLHLRPHGYTHCETVALPRVVPSDEEGTFFSAVRDVFVATRRSDSGSLGRAPPLVAGAAVSVRVLASRDEHGTVRVVVSAPACVLNCTSETLALRAERSASDESSLVVDANGLMGDDDEDDDATKASFGDAASFLFGRSAPVPATPGEGDALIPPSTRELARSAATTPATSPWGVAKGSSAAKTTGGLEREGDGPSSPGVSMTPADGGSTPVRAPVSDEGRSEATSVVGSTSLHALSPLRDPPDVSVGLSPGGGAESNLPSFASSSPVGAVKRASSGVGGFGVAMYGRSSTWTLASSPPSPPPSAVFRLRASESSLWSAATRLAPGDKPRVVRCPLGAPSGGCVEVLAFLRPPVTATRPASLYGGDARKTSGGAVFGAAVLRPRFTLRRGGSPGFSVANKPAPSVPLFFRHPGSATAASIGVGEETAVTRWGGPLDAPRALRFRPDAPGVWSWTAAVRVDRPGVTLLKSVALSDECLLAGSGAPFPPYETDEEESLSSDDFLVRKKLGFGRGFDEESEFESSGKFSVAESGSVRSSTSSLLSPRRGGAPRRQRPPKLYRVSVAPSASVRGAFAVDVAELAPRDARRAAPVRVENRSSVPIAVRQRDGPTRRFGCVELAEPRGVAHFAWDDPTLPEALVVSVPGGTMSAGDVVAPVGERAAGEGEGALSLAEQSQAATPLAKGAEDADAWSRQTVVRFDDPNKPPALLRVRLRTRADGGRRGAPRSSSSRSAPSPPRRSTP